jgi:hypothetical protein
MREQMHVDPELLATVTAVALAIRALLDTRRNGGFLKKMINCTVCSVQLIG